MEKKQGFFKALKEKVTSVLSPGGSRWSSSGDGYTGTKLSPIMEGPCPVFSKTDNISATEKMLYVMGSSLAPVRAAEPLRHLRKASSTQYILQQYIAVSGGQEILSSNKNLYAMGKMTMAVKSKTAKKVIKTYHSAGQFILWQMMPEMWDIELTLGRSKVHAGCNGQLVWHSTPCQGVANKGPVRPLRRALQGLDPLTTASVFSQSEYIGERKINGEDCFILKLCTDSKTLKLCSKGPVKFIDHVLCGYFSQRTGLLIHLEDSHWTCFQSTTGGDGFDWQFTIMNSLIDDYRKVEGAMVAHSGWSAVTVFKFSESTMSHTKIQMEEAWSIDDVNFNVAGLSIPFFNHDLECGSVGEAPDFNQGEEKNKMGLLGQGSAASDGSDGAVGCKVQV